MDIYENSVKPILRSTLQLFQPTMQYGCISGFLLTFLLLQYCWPLLWYCVAVVDDGVSVNEILEAKNGNYFSVSYQSLYLYELVAVVTPLVTALLYQFSPRPLNNRTVNRMIATTYVLYKQAKYPMLNFNEKASKHRTIVAFKWVKSIYCNIECCRWAVERQLAHKCKNLLS